MGLRYWELPEWAEDRIHSRVEVHLDIRDRIRVLLLGRCTVRLDITVEHAPGRLESTNSVLVPAIRLLWRKRREAQQAEPATRPAREGG